MPDDNASIIDTIINASLLARLVAKGALSRADVLRVAQVADAVVAVALPEEAQPVASELVSVQVLTWFEVASIEEARRGPA